MVLADAERIEAGLVGQHDLLDQVADALLWARLAGEGIRGQFPERVDADLHQGPFRRLGRRGSQRA